MIDDTSRIWLQLLERRSTIRERSKLHTSASRRKTFAAAMQQFEEQFTAAKVVTAATRPLNLYYGLMQAGMAIATAHTPGQWSFGSHGLELADTEPNLPDIPVRPKRISQQKGAYQVVTATTGSPAISSPVTIGALWASLPDLGEESQLPGVNAASALPVDPEEQSLIYNNAGIAMRTLFFQPPGAKVYIQADMPAQPERDAWFEQLITNYPSATDWHPDYTKWRTFGQGNAPGLSMMIRAPGFDVTKSPVPIQQATAVYDKLAPEYRFQGNRHLRPSIEGNGKPAPSPLMTWWLLLYSFSMLARYQPRKWAELLDIDNSPHAVHIRYALETALSAVPHLVLEALDRTPWLLSRSRP